MDDRLWIKFAEDTSLPDVMDAAAQAKLDKIFDTRDARSPWMQAASLLEQNTPPDNIIYWLENAPYIDWSYMVHLVSADTVRVVNDGQGGRKMVSSTTLSGLWKLIKAQWRISHYILARTKADTPLPGTPEEQIIESLALGLCYLSLTQRKQTPATRAQMADIQKRRTALSPAWQELFPPGEDKPSSHLPPFFWNTPPPVVAGGDVKISDQTEWRGIAVCGSEITGLVLISPDAATCQAATDPVIAVFPRARPDTVMVFPHVAAVLYGDGGTMSHACTVARGSNLSCITGLGQGFVKSLLARPGAWVRVNPSNGTVHIIEN